jgi:hypothetical protein
MNEVEQKIEDLKSLIKANNKSAVLSLMEMYQKECLGGGDMALIITHPPVITELHQLLVEHMKVHPKAMMLKRRIENRKKRAYLFMQAMINGVNLVNEQPVQ